MSNEARSASHRWLFEPDRLLVHADGSTEIVTGSLVRQRLSIPVKANWRAATWEDLDPADPSTAEAFDWFRSHPEPQPAPVPLVVFRDGVPDSAPVVLEAVEPVADMAEADDVLAIDDAEEDDDHG